MPRGPYSSDTTRRLPPKLDSDLAAFAAGGESTVRDVDIRSLDVGVARRFVRDVSLKTKVNHPHLILPASITMTGTGIARLIEPKALGVPLSEVLPKLTTQQLERVLSHVLIGLAHLHDIGLIFGHVDATHIYVEDRVEGAVGYLVGVEPRRRASDGDATMVSDLMSLHGLLKTWGLADGSAASAAMNALEKAPIDPEIDAHAAIAAMAMVIGRRPRSVSRVPLPTPNVGGHFFGRERSLIRVTDATRSALKSSTERRVAISGPRGAGLTTLLNEVALVLECQGVQIVRTVALGDGSSLFENPSLTLSTQELIDRAHAGPLLLAIDDADRLTPRDVTHIRRLLELPKELEIAVVMAIPECSGGLSTVGHGIAGACPTERLRGLRASDVQAWIAATGLSRVPLTHLVGAFDEGGGFLPATVARRLTGAFTGVVSPFLPSSDDTVPETSRDTPLPLAAHTQLSVPTDEAGVRFLSKLAEELAVSASEEDVVRAALPRVRQVTGAVGAAILDEVGAFVERGDRKGINKVDESDPFVVVARNLLRTCGSGSIAPAADPASGVTVYPFPNAPVGRGVALLGGLDHALPGASGRSHLVALAAMQTGQALAMIRTESRRRDAEIVSLENAWLRDLSRRAANESERLHTLHDKLHARTEELENATASLKALFDALTGHMVIAWGLDGIAGARNAAAHSMIGEATSIPVHFDAFAAEGTPRFDDLVRDAVNEDRVSIETRRRTLDGNVIPIQLTLSPLRGPDGGFRGWVEVSRDLTQEIDARHHSLLSERLASLGTLSAGVAHEFNNLLQGIMGWLEYALAVDDRGAVRRATATALGAAARASEVTHRLQAFARPRGESRVPTRLADLVEETIRLVARGLEAEGCRVVIDGDRSVAANVDQTCILQVILNLVTNARHAMAKASHRCLTVQTKLEGEEAIITVTDTGPGIPEDMQALVFDPFFTTKATRDDGAPKGTGLGLSLARSIVLEHGGALTLRSRPNEGATFEIRLPAVSDSSVEESSVHWEEEFQVAERFLAVLIVGNDASTRGVLAERLCMRGHAVSLATDVASAERMLARGGIDVLVVDDGVAGGEALLVPDALHRWVKGPRLVRLCCDPDAGDASNTSVQSLPKPFTAAAWVATVEGNPPETGVGS